MTLSLPTLKLTLYNKRQHKESKKASHTLEMHISDNGLVFRTYRMSTYQTERQNNPIEKQKRSDQATDRRENPNGQ